MNRRKKIRRKQVFFASRKVEITRDRRGRLKPVKKSDQREKQTCLERDEQ